MRAPFEITDPASSIAHYVLRMENALHDRAYLYAGGMYYVIDNYILFCLFLNDSHNLESYCANSIYQHEGLRFAVLPESLWELRKNIEEEARRFGAKSRPQRSWDDFLQGPDVKQFLVLMNDRGRLDRWPEIIEILVRMIHDDKQRSYILSVLQFGRIHDFAEPLSKLNADVLRGKVSTLMNMATVFGAAEIKVNEEDRLGAYRLLNGLRGRHHSDVVDAMVYAKVKSLNEVARSLKKGCVCRFFSHESMIEMLERSTAIDRRYVRGLTDSLMMLRREALSTEEMEDVLDSLRQAQNGGRAKGVDGGELLLETYRAKDGLQSLRKKLLVDFNQYSKNLRSEDLHSLLQLEAERFAQNLERLHELLRENPTTEVVVDSLEKELRKQIEDLYRAVNNFRDAESPRTLDDFMAPVEKAAWDLWISADGDKAQIEDLIIKMITEAKPTEDVHSLLEEVWQHDLDPVRLAARIRGEVVSKVDERLWPKLSAFIEELKPVPARQTVQRSAPVPGWRSELEKLVEDLVTGGPAALAQIDAVIVDRGGEDAKNYCRELIEKALENGPSEILTEALFHVDRLLVS